MLSFLYDCILSLSGLILLPKWSLERKSKDAALARIGLGLPKSSIGGKPSIWIHMVSVGEVRAMIPLYEKLKKTYPTTPFFLSTTTVTGKKEAEKSLKEGAAYFYLPLDHSFLMRRLVQRICPTLLLLAEGDLWYNMTRQVKERGGSVILTSGKLSSTSFTRLNRFPKVAKRLYSQLDLILAQSSTYASAFSTFFPSDKIHVTGNLKRATRPHLLTQDEKTALRSSLRLGSQEMVITLGSTHEGEEMALLKALEGAHYDKILLVPRHPHRFGSVQALIEKRGDKRVILVPQMGILTSLYQISSISIVGGSFLPGVGGHNVLEPIQVGTPALFGPHMEAQSELSAAALSSGAALQTSLDQLKERLQEMQRNLPPLQEKAKQSAAEGGEALDRAWGYLTPFLERGLR